MIDALFDSGHAADIVLGVLVAEAIWLRLRHWKWAEILGLLCPAMLLMLGLRAALTGADWYWIALPLALSLPVHLFDLRKRFAQRRDSVTGQNPRPS